MKFQKVKDILKEITLVVVTDQRGSMHKACIEKHEDVLELGNRCKCVFMLLSPSYYSIYSLCDINPGRMRTKAYSFQMKGQQQTKV